MIVNIIYIKKKTIYCLYFDLVWTLTSTTF